MTDGEQAQLRLKWSPPPVKTNMEVLVANVGPFGLTVWESPGEHGWRAFTKVRFNLSARLDNYAEERWLTVFASQLEAQLWCEKSLLALGQDIVAAFGKAGE